MKQLEFSFIQEEFPWYTKLQIPIWASGFYTINTPVLEDSIWYINTSQTLLPGDIDYSSQFVYTVDGVDSNAKFDYQTVVEAEYDSKAFIIKNPTPLYGVRLRISHQYLLYTKQDPSEVLGAWCKHHGIGENILSQCEVNIEEDTETMSISVCVKSELSHPALSAIAEAQQLPIVWITTTQPIGNESF